MIANEPNLAPALGSTRETSATLAQIDTLARRYADARAAVLARVNELGDEIAALHRRRVGAIKVASAAAADLGAELRALVQRAPQLFTRPKTLTLHGVTIGYRKAIGKVDWDDDEQVIALIRKHLPKQAGTLILTQERPSAEALKALDARDLARIGVRMEATGESVVVKSADSAIDKLVTRILREGSTLSSQ